MKKIATIKQAGATFKIPVNEAEEFVKDSKPVNEEELENGLTEDQRAIAWMEFEYQMQLLEREDNY